MLARSANNITRSHGRSSPAACSLHASAISHVQHGRRASASAKAAVTQAETVADIMTKSIIACNPEDSIDAALQKLVQNKVAGMPVVDSSQAVVGIVSDFDLLALDAMGKGKEAGLFPTTDENWADFNRIKATWAKRSGRKVKDVMSKPTTVKVDTPISDAVALLISRRLRRLPVVDTQGCLVGLISRSSILKAVLAARSTTADGASA